MAQGDIDPFEIGRRGLAIPFREFPIWLACALWPFASAIGIFYARRHAIHIPPLILRPATWFIDAIFDWCWMIALCRSTVLHLLTFPAARGFWLFVILKLGLSVVSSVVGLVLGTLFSAAMLGGVYFLDVSGPLVQVFGIIAAPLLFLFCLWVSLRLLIWPAHCAASGRLAGPATIWRGMQNHSFDALIIGLVTVGPILLVMLAGFILERTTGFLTGLNSQVFEGISTVLGTYTNSAFDAAMLIAYYAIFAAKETGGA